MAGRPARAYTSLETLRVGLPIGASIFMEASLFGTIGLLMARFGDVAVAAHQVAINFTALTYMLPVGLALATTIRVAQGLGRGDRAGADLSAHTGVTMALVVVIFPAMVMGLRPHWIVNAYTDTTEVARLAESFLRLAALFQFWGGLQMAAAGALRGYKDTRVRVFITFFAYWCVGLPLAAYLGFIRLQQPTGLWCGLIVGLGTAALLLSAKLYRVTHRG